MVRSLFGTAALLLAACSPGGTAEEATGERAPAEAGANREGAQPAVPGDSEDSRAFDAIAADETVHFTGNEPFWGGQVAFTRLTYSTPENPEGTTITVERFAGRGGVSWSGEYAGAPFTLAVTPGECSDGMSDRTYPYVATLQVQSEERRGCAWTEDEPFTAPPGYRG